MRLRNLKWLALLGPLGLLGLYQPMFFVMFGFWAFLPLFWADERTEINLGRAAAVSYTVTLAMLISTFLLIAFAQTHFWTSAQIFRMLATMLALTYVAHVLSLVATHLYYEMSGR